MLPRTESFLQRFFKVVCVCIICRHEVPTIHGARFARNKSRASSVTHTWALTSLRCVYSPNARKESCLGSNGPEFEGPSYQGSILDFEKHQMGTFENTVQSALWQKLDCW
ncbi:hypothetical protein ABVT39_006318 [Epinephelus coioides]